jgi:UDP-GlcNAc3NAcA epimerase
MLKIVTIIGARPQIIKAAALSRAVKNNFSGKIREVLVHTGQHYDDNMSKVFMDELGLPKPDHQLEVSSLAEVEQVAAMMIGIEQVLEIQKPNCLVLYGDTNSTLAGALTGNKMGVPVVHIEAGLRSFNRDMPEEFNRIACDKVATLLFSPTLTGYNNLIKEGFPADNKGPFTVENPGIYHCGDVMYDNALYFSKATKQHSDILGKNGLANDQYVLATIHRNTNTDVPARLTEIFSALNAIAIENKIPVVLPLHPRTEKVLIQNLPAGLYAALKMNALLKIIPPVSYLEMLVLEKNAKLVMTDSGGVQKEAFFFKRPCIILREETEWVELVECGSAIIAGADEHKVKEAFHHFSTKKDLQFPSLFGDGKAAEFICGELVKNFV